MARHILLSFYISKQIQLSTFAVLLCFLKSSASSVCGDKTFPLSPLYTDMEPVEIPSKRLNDSSITLCSRKCYYDATCSGFVYHDDGECSLFSTRFHALMFVNKIGALAYETIPGVPSDCYDVMMNGADVGGVYTIAPDDNVSPISVRCEIMSEESWLIIQRRTDGSETFYRTWNDYRDGFGDLNNEFWLGNTNIHRIISQGHYELKIDLGDFDGNVRYAVYKHFSLSSEEDYFRLSVGEYSGDAGDSLGYHNGFRFSTKDKDMDPYSGNCARLYSGAWWYTKCHISNLNGLYLGGPHSSNADGIEWQRWKGNHYSLKTTQMKIRPMKY